MVTGRFDISPRQQQVVSRLLQVAIGIILLVGLYTRNISVVINGGLALAVTFLPGMLERDFRISLSPGVTLWITLALFLHTIGMLGFYDEVWWFDHLTHTLSATIVAGIGYVTVRTIDERSGAVHFPAQFTFVYVLLFTLALGVFWEVLEFGARLGAEWLGFDPVLIQYGLDDSLLDLVFNTFGAFLVAMFGTDTFSDLIETLATRLEERRTGVGQREPPDRRVEMTRLGRVVSNRPTNARLSWVLVGFLVVVALGGIGIGALLPASLVALIVILAVVPVVAYHDVRAMLPWQLLLIASLPVFGAVFTSSWLTTDVVTYLAVAAVALVAAVELHLFTSVEMTPGFAVLLVIITTVAIAGVWAVGRWLADLYLGTELLLVPGLTDAQVETDLMWEFVYAVIAGGLAGVIFERRFRRQS